MSNRVASQYVSAPCARHCLQHDIDERGDDLIDTGLSFPLW